MAKVTPALTSHLPGTNPDQHVLRPPGPVLHAGAGWPAGLYPGVEYLTCTLPSPSPAVPWSPWTSWPRASTWLTGGTLRWLTDWVIVEFLLTHWQTDLWHSFLLTDWLTHHYTHNSDTASLTDVSNCSLTDKLVSHITHLKVQFGDLGNQKGVGFNHK